MPVGGSTPVASGGGMSPRSPSEPKSTFAVRAVYTYTGAEPSELSFNEGLF